MNREVSGNEDVTTARRAAVPSTQRERNRYGFFLFLGATVLGFVACIIALLRSNIDVDFVAWLYYVPAALGHAAMFAFALWLVFYLPFSFFRNGTIAATIFIICTIAWQTLLLLNGFVFSIYRFHINAFVVNLALHAGRTEFVIDASQYVRFALLAVCTVVLPCVFIIWMAKRWCGKPRKRQTAAAIIILIVCFLLSHAVHAVAAAMRQTSIQKSATALPYFFPLTMNRLLDRMGVTQRDDVDRLDYDVPTSDLAYPVRPLVMDDSIAACNILVVVIDSWNPRTFDSITTPNIYHAAQQSQVFTNHNAAGFGTRENIFSLFFGLSFTYETEFIVTHQSPLLIDCLNQRNVAIQAFPSAPLPSPPFHEVLFRKAPHVNDRTEGPTPFVRDQQITRHAIAYMEKQKAANQPFFNFMFYDLPHAISLPEEYTQTFQPSWTEVNYMALNNQMDPEPFFNLYRNCVYQVDVQVGILMDYMRESGLIGNTVVVITGDHGQEFNENHKNYWGHGSNYSPWQIHVPLILHEPAKNEPRRYTHMTTHYDIAPTLMKRYLGVSNPTADYSMGYDLNDPSNRYPHVVGDHVNYGFVLENAIVKTGHLGNMTVTDRNMNDKPRNTIDVRELQKGIEIKNRFYRKSNQ